MIFDDVLTIKNGKNQKAVENPNGVYPIYGSGGVMGYADDYICSANTVVIGRKGSINNPIFVDRPFWNVDTAFGLEAKTDVLMPRYLYYFCKHYDFEKLNKTVTIPSLTKSDLLKIEISLPKLAEQQSVVAQLSKVEDIINLRQQQLQKLDELVKSQFIEMFGMPTDETAKYSKVKIGELVKNGTANIKAGPFGSSLKKEYYVEKGYKIYGQEQVIKNDPTYGDYYIDEERFNSLRSCEVHAGDILISLVGTCGKTMIIPEVFEPGIINPRLLKISFLPTAISPAYFKYFFACDDLQESINSISGHSTMNVVNAGMLKDIDLIMPPIELQKEFEAFVAQTDKSKFAVQKALDEAQLLFDSLMQQYFG